MKVLLYMSLYIIIISSFYHQVVGAGALGDFPLLYYFRNREIKDTGLILFWVLTDHTY